MFNFFSKRKKTKKDNNEITNDCKDTSSNININSQIEFLKKNGWLKYEDFSLEKSNLLLMDDKYAIISAVIDDLENLNDSNSFHLEDYNIITVSSKMAGFDVLDILQNSPDIIIDYAFLDIILGGKKVINDKRIMIDGVDVAIQIWNKFPQAQILFFSGCIIEPSNDKSHFTSRFKTYRGEDLNNYILSKDINFDSASERLKRFFN